MSVALVRPTLLHSYYCQLTSDATHIQYAVRGELYLRAEELRKAGKEIIFTNGQSSRLSSHVILMLTPIISQLVTLMPLEQNP